MSQPESGVLTEITNTLPTLPPIPPSSPTKSCSYPIVLKLSYQNLNRLLSPVPSNIKSLNLSIKSMFSVSTPFTLFHLDSSDRTDIFNTKDLRNLYTLCSLNRSPTLKLYVYPKSLPLPIASSVPSFIVPNTLIRLNEETKQALEASGLKRIVNKGGEMEIEYRYGNKIFYKCKKKGCRGVYREKEGAGKIVREHTCKEVGVVSTMEGGIFERQRVITVREDGKEEMLFLVSEGQVEVLKRNWKQPQRILFSVKKMNGEWEKLMSVFMYDVRAKYYMAIGHCLIKGMGKSSYQNAISWFQREFGAYYKPSIIMTDFDFELFNSAHALYPAIPKFILISDFIFDMWRNAFKCRLISQSQVPKRIIRLLSEIPQLLYNKNDDTKLQFQNLCSKCELEEEYEPFISIYNNLFINSSSWYCVHSLMSTYKNIFLNCSKSHELHLSFYPKNADKMDCISIVKEYESNLYNFDEDQKKIDGIPSSLYQLIKTYFNLFKSKPVSQHKLFSDMINSMKEYGYKIDCNLDSESFDLQSIVKNEPDKEENEYLFKDEQVVSGQNEAQLSPIVHVEEFLDSKLEFADEQKDELEKEENGIQIRND